MAEVVALAKRDRRKEKYYWAARAYNHDGHAYLLRDVHHANGRFFGCQFATLDGCDVVWSDCSEGVNFADIKPLVRLSNG